MEKKVLFPLNCFGIFIENQLLIYVWFSFWTLLSILSFYMSVLIPIAYCLLHCQVVFHLLYKVVLAILSSLHFYVNFIISFISFSSAIIFLDQGILFFCAAFWINFSDIFSSLFSFQLCLLQWLTHL